MLINNATMKNILRYLVIAICCLLVTNAILAEEVHKVGVNKNTNTIKPQDQPTSEAAAKYQGPESKPRTK